MDRLRKLCTSRELLVVVEMCIYVVSPKQRCRDRFMSFIINLMPHGTDILFQSIFEQKVISKYS